MADGNYIEVRARLDKVAAVKDLQKDLNEISKQMLLQLQRVEISQDGTKSLQQSLNKIQDSLRLNIGGVSIDQTQTIKQAQQISQQITNAMNNNSGNGVKRAFDISDNVAKSLKKRYSDVSVLADTLQNKFKSVGSVTTEVLGHENKLIDQFRVTVTNADGAVEKLVYSLKQIEGTKRPAHAWEVVGATSSDNNIKLQEQLERQTIKASDASLRLSNNLESVKQKFAEIVQVHDGDANIANYLDNAVKAINALNGADSSNFNKLKINAENAIRTYTDYLNKLKMADTQAEQSQRKLDAQLVSTQKTLDHNIMILGNLSKNSIFGKNATSPEVVKMQANVDKLRESYQNLKTNTTDSIASPELVGKFKELNVQIVDTIVNSQKLAKTLGDKTTNVVPEVELNNLKTLMNNLKASDIEVDKLKADYGELVGLMIQAQDTGDWSNYLKQLSIFKSKFTEAKSEVRATTAATSDLARMAKSLASNKMNTFFDKNSNNAQVSALKTEINSLINEWNTLNSEIQTTGKVYPAMATHLEELKAKMQTATTAADTLQKNIKEVANAQKLASQKQSLDTRITSWMQNNTRASQETIVKLKEMQAQIQNADHQTMTNLNNQFRQVTANARAAGEAGMRLSDIIKQKLGKFAGWFSIATVVMRSVNELKNMYREVVELDTALVDLRKTTDGTNAQLEEFYFEANKIGKQLGVTTKEVIQAASSWSRLGYSIKDAQEMAKTSSIFASISPGMDIEQATDGLVSAMKAYKIEASDALDAVASKINAVGNSQALNNADIVDFLTRSSSAMAEANNSLEETIALGTAATEITRDASSVGNALKTVSMRLRGYDEETEQLSYDLKSLSGDIADLTKSAQHPMGVSIFTDETRTTYKSTYQILKDISGIYDELSDKQQAELLEKIAGKRNSQVVAAILNNFDAVNSSIETMQDSAGNAEQEMGVIMDSIEYKTNRLKETAVGIAQDIFQRDSTKRMVDNLTSLLEIINSLTKAVGGLGTAFVGLMAYKGFKGQNIFNVLGASVSGVNSIKNFFTKPVLTDTAVKLGITNSDIKILQDYNHSLQNGTNATLAFRQTMKGASPETRTFAKEMARGNASLNQLTTSSKAAAIGMTALNTAMNIAVSWLIASVISNVVKWFQELSKAEERAAEQAHEIAEQSKGLADKRQKEYSSLTDLIAKYKELAETEGNASVTSREKLRDIQKEITELVGKQANNIDLVNGKLDEELAKLNSISDKVLNQSLEASKNAYRTSQRDYASWQKKGNKEATGAYVWLPNGYYIEPKSNTISQLGNPNKLSINEQLDVINNLLDEYDKMRDEAPYNEHLYDRLLEIQQELSPYAEEQSKAINDYLESFTIQQTNKRLSWVTNLEMYFKARQEIVDELVNDPTINEAIEDGYLTNLDLSKYVDEYLSTISSLDKFRPLQSSTKANDTFDYADYKDQINEVTKTLDTLSAAYSKFSAGKAPASELMSLYDTFPELAQYGDDTSLLTEKIQELADTTVAPLVNSLSALGKTVKDPKQKAMIDGLVQSLIKMADLSAGIEKTADAVDKISDYVKYEEDNVQKIIDKLEEQKDEQNDILDNLKAQKDELEDIISKYEKVADTVDKYIDKTQIKPLEQQKSDVEEYYNTQIEKLKEENEERDRNIELQEKQDALANARKTKIKVYTESQGWTVQSDVKAIQNAEKELNDLQNEITIDNLEKQRDSEISDIEKQIKTWEDYKDAWKAQVEQITEADEELVASKILGADWHEKVADQDIDVMNNYGAEYVSYNNRLKNQVNVEISNMEKAIKAREKEIAEWKDYKEQITDINKTITESNDTYLQNLSQFVIDENSTWEERIKHMERNAEIIAMLNGKANEIPETDAESILAGSKMWSITKDDSILGLYSSKEEAEADKKNVIQNLVKKQIAPGMPSSVIETITKRIMESLHIKQYARGGISTKTGLSWLDGTSSGAEVIFNAAQAKQLYDIVANGNFGRMVSENILDGMKALVTSFGNKQSQPTPSSINISFPNATINAKDYDSFKNFMDTYTTDLLLKMQVGL